MKKERNVAAVFLLVAFCSSSPLFAAEMAKYAGEFMSTGVGARALGMGGAYVAAGGDVTYGYWNPAGLSQMNFPELAAMHSERFAGVVNYDYLAFSLPFRQKETIALSAIRLGVDDIPISAIPRSDLQVDAPYVDQDGAVRVNRPYVDRYVSDAEYAFYFSYARTYNSAFAFGANAKFVRKGVGDNSAWGIGFDVGAIWNPWRQLMVGMNIQDITTTLLAWDTGRKELIAPTAKPGVAYPFRLPFLHSRLLLASDVDIRFEGRRQAAQAHIGAVSFDFRLGGEISFYEIIALRLGRDDLGNFTAGAGLILSRLNIDYAFSQHTELEDTHRISLRIRLEEKRFARK
ncbi:PorV/PorQ family protein [candidate division KSB1 bacterium]|nr:PorV/PorQ family protein [candidate division KSB1 bacterium]